MQRLVMVIPAHAIYARQSVAGGPTAPAHPRTLDACAALRRHAHHRQQHEGRAKLGQQRCTFHWAQAPRGGHPGVRMCLRPPYTATGLRTTTLRCVTRKPQRS